MLEAFQISRMLKFISLDANTNTSSRAEQAGNTSTVIGSMGLAGDHKSFKANTGMTLRPFGLTVLILRFG
jgi:hypothetical protein